MHKILLVEDIYNIRELYVNIIEEMGMNSQKIFKVLAVKNATEAKEYLNQHRDISLAILDINLGKNKENGIQLGQYINMHYPLISIIYLTTFNSYFDEALKNSKMSAFIYKSPSSVELAKAIHIALANRGDFLSKEVTFAHPQKITLFNPIASNNSSLHVKKKLYNVLVYKDILWVSTNPQKLRFNKSHTGEGKPQRGYARFCYQEYIVNKQQLNVKNINFIDSKITLNDFLEKSKRDLGANSYFEKASFQHIYNKNYVSQLSNDFIYTRHNYRFPNSEKTGLKLFFKKFNFFRK